MSSAAISRPVEDATFPWKAVVQLVALTLLVRGFLLGIYFYGRHGSWEEFVQLSDAGSFLRMARVLVMGDSPQILSFYDQRVFPGWPLLIGLFLPVFPAPFALLFPTLACAAAVPCVFFLLTRSFWSSAIVAVLPPVWVVAGTHPMAEPVFLLAAIGAVLASRKKAWLVAGVLGGAACTIKHYGIFLALGLAWAAWFVDAPERRIHATLRLLTGAIIPVFLCGGLNLMRIGQLAPQFHVYSAPLEQLNVPLATTQLLDSSSGHWGWPFHALVSTPFRVSTPWWKIFYVYAHAAAAVWLTIRACLRRQLQTSPWEHICLIWLVGNTVASFCTGPYWGFHAFDRYVIWSWPAAAALNRDLLTAKLFPAGLILSLAAAVFSLWGR